MSIPKEPRQLMINVMYLVLTALLALNVSAEIFNAFDMVDKGLMSANSTLEESNSKLPALIKEAAKKKESLATYAERIDGITALSKDATAYIKGIMDKLIDESGNLNGSVDEGDYIESEGVRELLGKRDYAGTTRLMVDQGVGEELKAKMMEFKAGFAKIADPADQKDLESKIPIQIDDESWKKSVNKKESWADFTFGHMPLGACMPIFSKFINDIKASEASALNYLAGKVGVGGANIVLDKFTVVSAPKKSYVIKGEPFETEVFLSAAAGADSKTGISISVNGRGLPTNADGVAKYTETANSVGIKKYSAVASVKDPVSGEVKTYKSEYEYEVGERSVTISASKMNVFYMGVDNPVEVSAAGVPSGQIKVSMDGGDISKNSDGTFNVKVNSPGKAVVKVSAPGVNASKEYRVKRIPDPVPLLGGTLQGGGIGNGSFKGQTALLPILKDFEFDARCNMAGYTLVRVAKRQDPEVAANQGATLQGNAKAIQGKASPGDKYVFQEIKCKCPGDAAARNLGQLVFDIQ
jgi:gliding motility-associated protein GldM